MDLRRKGKEEFQEKFLSENNATKDASFRKLTDVCHTVRRKTNYAHVVTECLLCSHDEHRLKIR
jgi:hypothetical protein